MKVILVGPDGAGKTTLAKALCKELGYLYIKPTKEDGDKIERAIEFMSQPGSFVFDRFYLPDDQIYSELKGEPTNHKMNWEYRKLEEMMENRDVLYVYVVANKSTLEKRLTERGDDYIQPFELPSIIDMYEDFFNGVVVPYVKVDTDDITTAEAVKLIVYCILALKEYDFRLQVKGRRKIV